ncbi:LysR family transcriptional regulator (chromosome initiation inhibitor) [Litoreibacter ponti]|uniref:LysR family transcriptional regulator (Chromosome initiation inhibitor) n=1 Tax=Litoreibacter ponti TaxID=1510457 RepID=A0A2T6BDF8_9RHOB|nr:LysR family transcriptional regulator ArgP [Litoreibacter ponti]PTX54089.1 LysR family transcriptional regulator (chromosome initiation inhibitor) [Litoreibacter ponti]
MLDYTQLDALSAVLKTGSFDGAAGALNITQSAVSQRIKALENRVGAVLILRGQPCTATPAGARLAAHADAVRLMEAGLLDSAPAENTPLRLAANADSLATWMLPALAETDGFLFDLVIDDQDHSANWLRSGEVAAAVTGHPGPVQGCDSHALGALRYYATASPEFVERHFSKGVTAEALSRAPALTFNRKDRLQRDWATGMAGTPVTLPTHHFASSQGFIEAASLGMGWGMNPEPLLRDALARGALCKLTETPLDTPLYWQVARYAAGPLAPLTRAIKAAARASLIQEL